jgi:hypothetical protein
MLDLLRLRCLVLAWLSKFGKFEMKGEETGELELFEANDSGWGLTINCI